jgi:co-chaperonin GroES (HSP10)
MRPLRDKVIVKRIQPERKTESGIILQSNAGEPDKAEIIAVGPEVEEVTVGEIVLLNWNRAVTIPDDLFVIPVEEIIFVFED